MSSGRERWAHQKRISLRLEFLNLASGPLTGPAQNRANAMNRGSAALLRPARPERHRNPAEQHVSSSGCQFVLEGVYGFGHDVIAMRAERRAQPLITACESSYTERVPTLPFRHCQ